MLRPRIAPVALTVLLAACLGAAPAPTGSRGATPTDGATTRPATTPTPTPRVTATQAGRSPTPTGSGACENTYIAGAPPVVAPRVLSDDLDVALDQVKVGVDGSRAAWAVRFFNRQRSPGAATIGLSARVTGPDGGEIRVVGYQAGPPNAGSEPVREAISLPPCHADAVPGSPERGVLVLVVMTGPISSGQHALTLADVVTPRGGKVPVTFTVRLTCAPAAGGEVECR